MNTTEINGFQIDKFNQYNLNVGKQEGICPLCSADRKPINQKNVVKFIKQIYLLEVPMLVDVKI